MRLVCPHCAAAYDVPPSLLAGRRAVRCARCGREWDGQNERPVPENPSPAVLVPSPPQPAAIAPSEPLDRPAGPTPAPRTPMTRKPTAQGEVAVLFGWAASVLLLVLGIWGAVMWRADLMQVWPPSQRLYAAIGLTHGR